jgi:TM2 domain-containing membrane protein YozV
MIRSLFFLTLVFCCMNALASGGRNVTALSQPQFATDTVFVSLPAIESAVEPVPEEWKNKKKFVSALLAFPFPFGFVGAHRVMLGCKPWVPVVYVATFGGCFGILPLIDFCVIVFSKDLAPYENNPDIFMWVK